jgi:hypothetical protein
MFLVVIIIIIIIMGQIIGSKSEDVDRASRKLHVVELHALYFSPYTIKATERSRTRWAGHVALMEVNEMNRIILLYFLEHLRVYRRMIVELNLEK